MLISVSQINQTQLALAIQQNASGAAFSGNFVAYAQASGFMGPTVVWTTGGSQDIAGLKTFLTSPSIPYSGGTGAPPSAQWVIDKIAYTSGWAANTYLINANLTSMSGQLLSQLGSVTVTGSNYITGVNFSGIGGTKVIWSGNQILVSGGSSSSSNVSVTGSSAITSPNLTGAGTVNVSYNGTYVLISGTSSAAGTPDSVTTTGTYILAGNYTFSGSPFVPTPTQPSGATNILFVSGVSGVLTALNLTTSGVLYGQMTGISGAIQVGGATTNNYYITGTGVVSVYSNASGNITNTFNITSGTTNVTNTGTTTNNFNVTGGTVNNNFNLSGITGNFVNLSFYYDPTTLATGLNNAEAFIGRSFAFTGYAIGCINTGTQGYFSGSLYQRTPTNAKTNFINFSLNSGQYFTGVGGFNQTISGMNRLGLDIYLLGTGITGLSVGIFGVGY